MAGGQHKAEEFQAYIGSIGEELSAPLVLVEVEASRYDAVVLPGGHGPMADLYRDEDLSRILITADKAGRIIAPFCHGPAGLLSAVDED